MSRCRCRCRCKPWMFFYPKKEESSSKPHVCYHVRCVDVRWMWSSLDFSFWPLCSWRKTGEVYCRHFFRFLLFWENMELRACGFCLFMRLRRWTLDSIRVKYSVSLPQFNPHMTCFWAWRLDGRTWVAGHRCRTSAICGGQEFVRLQRQLRHLLWSWKPPQWWKTNAI